MDALQSAAGQWRVAETVLEIGSGELQPIGFGHLSDISGRGEAGMGGYRCMAVVGAGQLANVAAEYPPVQVAFVARFRLDRAARDTKRSVDRPVVSDRTDGAGFDTGAAGTARVRCQERRIGLEFGIRHDQPQHNERSQTGYDQ